MNEAAFGSTWFLLLRTVRFCRSWLVGSPHRSEDGLRANLTFTDVPGSTCRSWLASEGGLQADLTFTDVPGSTVGAGLPAKTAYELT
ncbi:hypothetical protein BJ917_1330 [Pseudomonas sp. WPR_5_2]|nr:hypothetical protein BJ917_1330 [Pseudomonas sp. WPR_5_2]